MFPFGFLPSVVAVFMRFSDDGGERFGQTWADLFVVGDVEPGVERLVRESVVDVAYRDGAASFAQIMARQGIMTPGDEHRTDEKHA